MTLSIRGFIAGWCAGITGLFVGHPADTVKVRQQVHPEGNIKVVFWRLFKTEGVLGFYRGLFFPLMMAGIQKSAYFGVYSNALSFLRKESVLENQAVQRLSTKKRTNWNSSQVYIAGCTAGLFHAFFSCPIDLIKVRIQALQLKGSVMKGRILFVVKDVYKNNGVVGFQRGLFATMVRDIPSSGLYFLLHEYILSLGYDGEKDTYSLKSQIFSGGIAGTITWLVATPFDVVKSRIQADDLHNPKYNGIVDCFRKSFKEGGIIVFCRGIILSVVRGFPVNAATFLSFEYVYDYLSFME